MTIVFVQGVTVYDVNSVVRAFQAVPVTITVGSGVTLVQISVSSGVLVGGTSSPTRSPSSLDQGSSGVAGAGNDDDDDLSDLEIILIVIAVVLGFSLLSAFVVCMRARRRRSSPDIATAGNYEDDEDFSAVVGPAGKPRAYRGTQRGADANMRNTSVGSDDDVVDSGYYANPWYAHHSRPPSSTLVFNGRV